MSTHTLTAASLRTITVPPAGTTKHFDGGGLFLAVSSDGKKCGDSLSDSPESSARTRLAGTRP